MDQENTYTHYWLMSPAGSCHLRPPNCCGFWHDDGDGDGDRGDDDDGKTTFSLTFGLIIDRLWNY